MKKNLIFGLLLCLAPAWAEAQVVDTAAVVREVDSLIQVSRALTNQQQFDQALEVSALAEKLALEKLGWETPVYGRCCFNRGRVFHFKSDCSRAEKWYLETQTIQEKVIGKDHPQYAMTLNNLANVYWKMDNYEKAEQLHLEAKKIRGIVLGKEHPDYAMSLHNLGTLYYDMVKYEEAKPLYLEAKAIRERTIGKEHPDYAWSLNNLANLYFTMGSYEKAEPLYLEAKAIRGKILGKEHPDYALSLYNMANMYYSMGNYEEAETLFIEAKNIQEKMLGKEHPRFMWTLYNLGNLYYEMGNYNKSELMHLEAKALREKVLGREHPDYAWSLNGLANLYNQLGNYEKAEPICLESIAIREKVPGKEHPDYAQSLNTLANLYYAMGLYGKAEPFFLEAKAVQEKTLGKEHPSYVWTLNNLANLYAAMGNYVNAEQMHLEAKDIREKVLGKGHPDYAASLNNLANLYWKVGDYEKTEIMFDQLTNLNESLIVRSLHHLSERELNSYLHKFSADQNQMLSFAYTADNGGLHVSQICYDHILFDKGFLLYTANQIKRLALSEPVGTENFNLLKSYERRLATEYTRPIAERDSTNISILEEKANTLEKNLARTVTGYGEAMRQVKWQDVQAALKPGETAVEFVHYRYYTPKATDSVMYAALVLMPGDTQPHFIPLFEEKALAPLLRGAAGGSNFLKINALYALKAAGSKSKSLYELIWQPLESLLAGSRTVYCSPSGLLHRINLAAIPASDGKAFGDSRQLVLLGSTRQLVVPPVVIPSANAAYLAGGIRYATDSTAIAYANRSTSGSRSIEQASVLVFQPDSLSATRGGVLDYLPATATEVRKIGQTLAAAGFRAKVDTGFYATEEAFRQLGVGAPSPRIVHLATHGYFFPDPKPDARGEKVRSEMREPVFKMSEHPMIRSGLIMAGAKQAWLTGKHPAGLEDGILTAYEISQMNLSGTELVVLSACETGLGDIMGNEGVYGLQRAFKIAGARYLIMSLWKVDDRSTQEFMTAFYRHWLTDKQPVPQAFRAAQREVRAKHPGAYDWAGFVLVE